MTARDFCFWLQGYLEITRAGEERPALSGDQLDCVQKHLAMVFAHDVDPKLPPQVASVLDQLHHGGMRPRC